MAHQELLAKYQTKNYQYRKTIEDSRGRQAEVLLEMAKANSIINSIRTKRNRNRPESRITL